jgi:DNA invertase Pin-like site-specific DNA recombinase
LSGSDLQRRVQNGEGPCRRLRDGAREGQPTTALGEALYNITIVWAMLEKATMRERIRAGMERAPADSKRIGRQPRTSAVTDHSQWTLADALNSVRKGGDDSGA